MDPASEDLRRARAVRAAALAEPGVYSMGGGIYAEAATYGAGEKVVGVVVGPEEVRLHVVASYPQSRPVVAVAKNVRAVAADRFTGYRAAAQAFGGLSASSLAATGARVALGVVGAVLALLALLLLLRELTFGRRIARSAVIEDEPGRETTIKSRAAKTLAEGAAREAGAISPSVSLATEKKGAYRIYCDVQVSEGESAADLAESVRRSVLETFGRQGVPAREAEVTVRGVKS